MKRTIFRALDAGGRRRARSSRRTRAPSRSRRSRRDQPARSVSSGSTSSTRRRSCALVEVVAGPRDGRAGRSMRGGRARRSAGARRRSASRRPGLHRQPGQPTVHDRGPRGSSRPSEATHRGDRRGDARGRLPDGSVRAHGPHRDRRQPGRDARRSIAASSTEAIRRGSLPAVADPGGPRRGRRARPQDRAAASTGTSTAAWPCRRTGSPRRPAVTS